MKTTSVDVKSKSEVVGVVTVPEYESISEAVEELGDAKCLELINSQNKTNIMNEERASKVGRPTKKWIRSQVMNDLTTEEITAAAAQGGGAAIEALVDRKVKEKEAELGYNKD